MKVFDLDPVLDSHPGMALADEAIIPPISLPDIGEIEYLSKKDGGWVHVEVTKVMQDKIFGTVTGGTHWPVDESGQIKDGQNVIFSTTFLGC